MHRRSLFASSLVLLALAHPLSAADGAAEGHAVDSKVESIGLFKNGLAVVERTVELPGGGVFRIEDVPTPVHGAFFIESATPVVTRVTTTLVDAPLDLRGASLQERLAGKQVRIRVRDKDGPPIEGAVATIQPDNTARWDRRYGPTEGYSYLYRNPPVATLSAERFLVLDTKTGRSLVDQSEISAIDIVGDASSVKVRKPVLLLQAAEGTPKQTVRVSYLTKGIAWAPGYRVQLLDDRKLSIDQHAVIRNELMPLRDVEVFLISGFPSIEFAHVDSPLSLRQNWAAFFQQLAQRTGDRRTRISAVVQQAAVATSPADQGGIDAAPPDESIDVHYESIGRQTLDEGDALSLHVGGGEADYERIVEWTVPDMRNEHGAYIADYHRHEQADLFEDNAWDAVKFKNPLPFAMTTAPATFMRDGRFLGQQLSRWVNRGEETTLRVTKALSIRTRATETEDSRVERADVWVGGRQYRKVSARGELVIKNYRKTDVVMVIKRQFSGDLVSADENPDVTLREEGMWSVNRRNEMKWTITLKPGEERTLKYAYTLLSSN